MKTKNRQTLTELRRAEVQSLLSKGLTQREISKQIGCSLGLVNSDIQFIRSSARENLSKYVTTTLPEEMELSLVRLSNLMRELHKDLEDTNTSKRDKHNAISLINQCTSLKLEILGAGALTNELNQHSTSNISNNIPAIENTHELHESNQE